MPDAAGQAVMPAFLSDGTRKESLEEDVLPPRTMVPAARPRRCNDQTRRRPLQMTSCGGPARMGKLKFRGAGP